MEQDTTPYAPPENVVRVLERWRKVGFPQRVNAEYLGQLGITENIIPRVTRALEYLGLVEGGKQTALAERLQVAPEDEWQGVLREAIINAYREVLRVVDPTTASRKQVDDAFRPMKPKGQRDRMVTLFLGLCYAAGIEVKEPPSRRPGKGEAGKGSKKPDIRLRPSRSTAVLTPMIERPALPSPGRLHPALTGILAAVSDLETLEDLERWIESFRATFKMVKKV